MTLAACSAAENVALSVPGADPAVIANPSYPTLASQLNYLNSAGGAYKFTKTARTAASRASS